MKNFFYILIFILSGQFTLGQSINITDPDFPQSNPLTCSNYTTVGNANFFDDGGTGDYSPNINETITICPDLPNGTPKIQASFGTGTGLTWDVHASDFITVYDGPNTSSPVIGTYNSATAPTGFGAVASWTNTSGCLTIEFISDGSNEGTGWEANISCASPSQDMDLHMEAFVNTSTTNSMFPLDTGYVNICQGDSVLLVAKPLFPYSLENTNSGYSQNMNNIDFLWEFSDGQVGPNDDSVWFKPQNDVGVFANLTITDEYPHNASIRSRIRVSPTPDFSSSGPLEDTVCFGQQVELSGGVTTSDTAGVSLPLGTFELGGNFAGLTFLPDGSNAEYTTDINMASFTPGAVVTAASDIQQMCVNMEHSFLGDLEMWLECPNGTNVLIFNSYAAGGNYPGGFGGGGTYLGEPNDSGTGPGNGYEYCFSSVNNTWSTFENDYAANTIPTPPTAPSAGNTVDPNGIWAPEESFADFVGCPLNGDWTLHIKDNWGGDDGYIFEWGIYFDPALYPTNETYQTSVVDAFWTPDPTIVTDPNNDTSIVVEPPTPGDYTYQFNVVDDFGCSYDTTLAIHVLDTLIEIETSYDTIFCMSDSVPVWASATGTVAPFTFDWSNGESLDSVLLDTAYYDVNANGLHSYPVTVTDQCGFSEVDSAFLFVNQTLGIDTLLQSPADCGLENGYVSGMGSGYTGTPKYLWKGPGLTSQDSVTASVWSDKPSGWYYFSIKDDVCIVNDSIFLEQNPPPVADFTPTPAQGAAPLDVTFVNNSDPGSSYVWDFGNGEGITVNDLSDQFTTYYEEGTYTVTLEITEGNCSDQATRTVTVFFPMTYDLPNVFTPNGDGQNDLFTINAEYATKLEVVIVNRWGNVVYESTDLNFAWNGQIQNNGAECNDGTYFYQFKIQGSGSEVIEEQGFVQLVRD
ncbi:T9SS type B sorting domain-containing protein [Brumimicrobium aurantiacum]|uniref:PKD domain-containing protein n=1 Tax=Brumimicrobium aurantiacum TaxID=1737063 RepID=A0A3E1F202_9FLAO|nr:gliding motility-associated C-terminal domain-containing protein [Brumimicrobium aurantiacum]RFC55769.1 hypothetical protein DXU93_02200 [Brumimicrobium aurantiacum]